MTDLPFPDTPLNCGDERSPPPSDRVNEVKVYHYLLLCLAMITCSSGGCVFALMINIASEGDGVSPFLLASWRLMVLELFQMVPFCIEMKFRCREGCGREEGMNVDNGRNAPPLNLGCSPSHYLSAQIGLLCSGVALGVHFSSWVYSLGATSLTHSLFLVSTHPILLVGGRWIGSLAGACRGPTQLEVTGSFVAVVGGGIMTADVFLAGSVSGNGIAPTLRGDASALFGAAGGAIYLTIGDMMRRRIPTWMYAFPVVFWAWATSATAAGMFGNAAWGGMDDTKSLLGWTNPEFILYAVYLGIGPGNMTCACCNFVLAYSFFCFRFSLNLLIGTTFYM